MDRWKTFSVVPEGGLIENLSPLVQGERFPGSLIDARNFEPSPVGGYRRIKGYEKFDSTQINSVSTVVDAVFLLGDTCLALQNKIWYKSSGAGWTSVLTQTNAPVSVLASRYNWSGTDSIIICDGANAPFHFDGTTLTTMIATNTVEGQLISTSTANNIFAACAVQEFHEHMFFSVGQYIRFSAPNTAGLVDGTSGSGEFITGTEKCGMAPWREQLFLFGNDRIGTVSGNSSTDFIYKNVTHKVGVVTPQTIREMNGDIYFLSFDGVRTIAGTIRNQDVELGSTTRTIPKTMETLDFRNSGRAVHAVSLIDVSQYRLFVGGSALTDAEGEGLLGGIRVESTDKINIEWFKIRGINTSCSDSALNGTTEIIVHGGYDGYVYRQERGSDFDGASVDAFLRFPYWTIETPEIRKTMYKGKFYLQSDNIIDPTVGYDYNYNLLGAITPPSVALSTGAVGYAEYGGALVTYGDPDVTYGSNFPIQADIALIGSGNNVSFTISSNDILTEYSIQSLTIEYGLDGRR